jgi:hypothetical protein
MPHCELSCAAGVMVTVTADVLGCDAARIVVLDPDIGR